MITDELTIAALFCYLVFTEVRNYFERKTLLDRLMARDFQDLVVGETERKLKVVDKRDDGGSGIPL